MNSQGKAEAVAELNKSFTASSAAFVINPERITCEDLTGLRRKLRPSGAKVKVVKNTLARRAVANTAAEPLEKFFTGPTAIILSGKDPVSPAKLLNDFAKGRENFQVKGGIVDGALVSPAEIQALATMPSREELLGKLLALINTPAIQLVRTLNAPAASLVRLLGAWKGEIEKKS